MPRSEYDALAQFRVSPARDNMAQSEEIEELRKRTHEINERLQRENGVLQRENRFLENALGTALTCIGREIGYGTRFKSGDPSRALQVAHQWARLRQYTLQGYVIGEADRAKDVWAHIPVPLPEFEGEPRAPHFARATKSGDAR